MCATEKEATRITRHLKSDDTLAAQTYRYTLADGKAYGGEASRWIGSSGNDPHVCAGQCDTAEGTSAVLCFGLALKKLRSVKYVRA